VEESYCSGELRVYLNIFFCLESIIVDPKRLETQRAEVICGILEAASVKVAASIRNLCD
jgi:hypothetical protein